MTMKEMKIINWSLIEPHNSIFKQFKNDKAEFKVVYCSNSENCNLFKMGKCMMLSIEHEKCPYGKLESETGFTPKAKNYHKWIEERQKKIEGIKKLKKAQKIDIVGDYVWNPFDLWTKDRSIASTRERLLFYAGQQFIEIEKFTPSFINKMVHAKPQAAFGGIISKWIQEDVPKMLQQIKEVLPNVYKEWASLYPKDAERFEIKTHVGRTAILQTLAPGKVWEDKKKGSFYWDSKHLISEDFYDLWFPFKGQAYVKINPKPLTEVKIISDDLVKEDTIFVS